MNWPLSNNAAPCILAIFIGWFIYRYFVQKKMSPLRKMPGPFTWSPLGQMLTLLKNEPAEPFIKWSTTYGQIFCYQSLLNEDRVAILDPKAIKHVLVLNSHNYRKPAYILRLIKPLFGNGVTSSEGRSHAQQRQVLNPIFKYANIKALVPMFQNYANLLASLWLEEAKNNEVEIDILKDLTRLTLDITCKGIFDFECNSLANQGNEISESFRKIITGSELSFMSMIPVIGKIPTAQNVNFANSLKRCHQVVEDVIDQKLRQFDTEGISADRKSILDIMLSLRDKESNQCVSRQQLHDQIMTFLFAGHETTSVSMTWTLYTLAKNPDIQKKARQEVTTILGENPAITWEVLDKLTYLENVIRESLRLFPPAPITFRVAVNDDKIENYDIPKGTVITIIPPHRLPDYFPEPLQFNPDRWENSNRDRYSYIPFLAGPRTCIGNRFALAEMKTILAMLLRKLSFRLAPETKIIRKMRLTMRPSPDLKLRVTTI